MTEAQAADRDLAAMQRLWGREVTYRHVETSFSEPSGVVEQSTLEETVTAIRLGPTTLTPGAEVWPRAEAVRFLIRAADLTGRPQEGDQIADGPTVYEVRQWGLSSDERAWTIEAAAWWGTEAVYRRVWRTFSASSGTVELSTSDQAVSAVRSAAAVEAIEPAEGQALRRRVVFRIRTAELGHRPGRGDLIVESGGTWEVLQWSLSADRQVWEIVTTG